MSLNKGITLGELAKKLGAKLDGDPEKLVFGLNTLLRAKKDEVSFLARGSFIKDLKKTKACAVIISKENSQLLIEDAKNAGLNVECFSDISMLDVFPKNN